jgi:hypothetical protein
MSAENAAQYSLKFWLRTMLQYAAVLGLSICWDGHPAHLQQQHKQPVAATAAQHTSLMQNQCHVYTHVF